MLAQEAFEVDPALDPRAVVSWLISQRQPAHGMAAIGSKQAEGSTCHMCPLMPCILRCEPEKGIPQYIIPVLECRPVAWKYVRLPCGPAATSIASPHLGGIPPPYLHVCVGRPAPISVAPLGGIPPAYSPVCVCEVACPDLCRPTWEESRCPGHDPQRLPCAGRLIHLI